MDNTPDKQTIFKADSGYYLLHSTILLKRGYTIVIDTQEFTTFFKSANKSSDKRPCN